MSDKKSSESRRKLLKSIAAGSGAIVAGKSLPENWKKPVVDSVLLPAHAQTSPGRSFFSVDFPRVQTTLCLSAVEGSASLTGNIGGAAITIPNIPVPGSISGDVSGTNYTITGTSQLLSVPYALYAKTSGSSIPGPQGPAGVDGADGAFL